MYMYVPVSRHVSEAFIDSQCYIIRCLFILFVTLCQLIMCYYRFDIIWKNTTINDRIIKVHEGAGSVIPNNPAILLSNSYHSEPRRRVSVEVSSPPPPLEGTNNPLYDNIDDVRPTSLRRQQDIVEMVDCPAYGTVQGQKRRL